MQLIKCIGVMSGTSLDGVDLVEVEFKVGDNGYDFKIVNSSIIEYNDEILNRLRLAPKLSGLELTALDLNYGNFIGMCINSFIEEKKIEKSSISYVASHGYTVFHQPAKGFTLQIGCGQSIATRTGLEVISDFRTKDVLYGGQGAPLVPIGDQFLFSQYDACLNLGGFANVTLLNGEEVKAFDISPANLPLNYLMEKLGKTYDEDGAEGRKGRVDGHLLNKLNELTYYKEPSPKSLGTEWLESEFISLYTSVNDPIRTVYEHIAYQIGVVLNSSKIKSVLITGGGAFNSLLMELIEEQSDCNIEICDKEIVEFKEALIFGFLGLRFKELKFNCLSSVTGAKSNVIGGVLHKP
jgi:anhydro-N-acetylmuramic acid kinase